MKKQLIFGVSLLLSSSAFANYGADYVSIKNIRVMESGDYLFKPAACFAGPCQCPDYWASEAYGLTGDGKSQQLSLLLAAKMSDHKVYVYYNSEDGQCRQKQIPIEGE